MRHTRTSNCTILAIVVIALVPAHAIARQTDPAGEVVAAVKESIRVLEMKDYVAFVKTFMRPAELEEAIAKFKTVDGVADAFAKGERAAVLLERLKAAAKLEPAFRREGTIATYTMDPPIGKERTLSLQKIGDRWYLRD